MYPTDTLVDNGIVSPGPDGPLSPPGALLDRPPPPPVPPEPTGPRMPRRIKWLDLPEEYGEAGMKIKCWVNYPARLGQAIDSGDSEQVYPALYQVILEHNGWIDENGQLVPPATTRGFWDTISTELAVTLLRLISLEGSRLPSSLKRPNAS